MSSGGYLNKWWFWLVLVIIFIIVIYFYTRITGKGIRPNTKTTNVETVTNRERAITKWNAGSVVLPQIETLTEDVDFTPSLPKNISEELVYNDKKQSKGERECHRVMEKIYNVPFQVQVRPEWLKNPRTGRCLELDISELKTLKIAVEYNGEQHYRYVKKYHKDLEAFRQQVYRDSVKIQLCQEYGIYLITVPYNVPLKDIEAFIVYHLPEAFRKREELQKIAN